jgi:hypothetical protein
MHDQDVALGPKEDDMERAAWMARISIDAAVHHGEPCIKGTRIPVSLIVGSIADGDRALFYAAEAVREAPPVPLAS